jgi:hypothetical protein
MEASEDLADCKGAGEVSRVAFPRRFLLASYRPQAYTQLLELLES